VEYSKLLNRECSALLYMPCARGNSIGQGGARVLSKIFAITATRNVRKMLESGEKLKRVLGEKIFVKERGLVKSQKGRRGKTSRKMTFWPIGLYQKRDRKEEGARHLPSSTV